MSFAIDMRDAGRLVHFWSRREWKYLPLEFVLVPALDAPVLVFDQPPLFTDFDHSRQRTRICLALPMLQEARVDYPRSFYIDDNVDDVRKAQWLAARKRAEHLLRRIWCQLVDQADYYTWPDATHYGVPAFYEFAPDA